MRNSQRVVLLFSNIKNYGNFNLVEEQQKHKRIKKLAPLWRHSIEIGFIIFLFYSNLLMGEYTHSGIGKNKGILWGVQDIFTINNFIMSIILAIIGHLFFEFLRKRV
jgi:uncharacterized protein with PQ loop repeat